MNDVVFLIRSTLQIVIDHLSDRRGSIFLALKSVFYSSLITDVNEVSVYLGIAYASPAFLASAESPRASRIASTCRRDLSLRTR